MYNSYTLLFIRREKEINRDSVSTTLIPESSLLHKYATDTGSFEIKIVSDIRSEDNMFDIHEWNMLKQVLEKKIKLYHCSQR